MSTAIGLIFLVLALFGSIVNVPSFLILKEQSIYLRVIWRYLITLIITVPILMIELYNTTDKLLTSINENKGSLIIQSILQTIYVYLVYYAATKTFVSHTLIFSTIPILFISIWKLISHLPFTRLDYIGIILVIFGMLLCLFETSVVDSIVLMYYREKYAYRKFMCRYSIYCTCHMFFLY